MRFPGRFLHVFANTDLKPFTTTIHYKERSWISSFWCLYSQTYKGRSNSKQVPSTSKGLVNLPFIRLRGRKNPDTLKTGVSERGAVGGMERQEDTVFPGLQRPSAIFSPVLPGHLRQEVLILPCLLTWATVSCECVKILRKWL